MLSANNYVPIPTDSSTASVMTRPSTSPVRTVEQNANPTHQSGKRSDSKTSIAPQRNDFKGGPDPDAQKELDADGLVKWMQHNYSPLEKKGFIPRYIMSISIDYRARKLVPSMLRNFETLTELGFEPRDIKSILTSGKNFREDIFDIISSYKDNIKNANVTIDELKRLLLRTKKISLAALEKIIPRLPADLAASFRFFYISISQHQHTIDELHLPTTSNNNAPPAAVAATAFTHARVAAHLMNLQNEKKAEIKDETTSASRKRKNPSTSSTSKRMRLYKESAAASDTASSSSSDTKHIKQSEVTMIDDGDDNSLNTNFTPAQLAEIKQHDGSHITLAWLENNYTHLRQKIPHEKIVRIAAHHRGFEILESVLSHFDVFRELTFDELDEKGNTLIDRVIQNYPLQNRRILDLIVRYKDTIKNTGVGLFLEKLIPATAASRTQFELMYGLLSPDLASEFAEFYFVLTTPMQGYVRTRNTLFSYPLGTNSTIQTDNYDTAVLISRFLPRR